MYYKTVMKKMWNKLRKMQKIQIDILKEMRLNSDSGTKMTKATGRGSKKKGDEIETYKLIVSTSKQLCR